MLSSSSKNLQLVHRKSSFFFHIEKVEFAQVTSQVTCCITYIFPFVLNYLNCPGDYFGNYGSEDEAEVCYSIDTMIYSSTDH